MSTAGERVRFGRDCEVIQIPAGIPAMVPAGTEAVVTQALGGTYTLQVAGMGSLARLAGKDAEAIGLEAIAAEGPSAAGDLEQQVWQQLRSCYDPEIPVNIVDLGLVYDMRISAQSGGKSEVEIKMTLTAPGCGMGTSIAGDAEQKIMALDGVERARVEVVWEPAWNPRMISPEGRKQLGIE
jgi:probable FeS assembly SUF system protein SufT